MKKLVYNKQNKPSIAGPMKSFFNAAILALQFLTRIPISKSIEPIPAITGKALIMFPGIGLLLGLAGYCLWQVLSLAGGLHIVTIAIILLCVETMLTGAFHLDGLADTFDAFLSPATSRETMLEIMKDSRIGVMGAVALILGLGLKAALLTEILSSGHTAALIMYPAAGRLSQVALYVISPYVRKQGIGLLFSQAATLSTLMFASLWLLPCITIPSLLPALAFFIIGIIVFRHYVTKKIGGITGDILGSVTVLSEIAFLLGAAILR
ncbi:MAG: adenosylcobinamide-GDP ribazoletransferase [Deltaproteobacteria bacterium]|nr:adenosylcobinamide-GDP ribazoletransferase [Deltaproteobacteria bacterium]